MADKLPMADIFFTQADTYGLSLKETMDRNFGQNLSGAYEGEIEAAWSFSSSPAAS